MNISDTLKLIGFEYVKDEFGVGRKVETVREVFCDSHSVTQTEFFSGQQSGLKPDLKFTVFVGDYDGETVIEFHDVRYSVYRTYSANMDYIELYVQKDIGVQNGNGD